MPHVYVLLMYGGAMALCLERATDDREVAGSNTSGAA